jgi:hypothetical protein
MLWAAETQAHNSQVGLAYPIQDVQVDGDLTDWPTSRAKIPITRPEHGAEPRSPEDFQAFFSLGYNKAENALYLAVEVQDESIAIDSTSAATWNNQDGFELYLDLAHGLEHSTAVQYFIYGDKSIEAAEQGERLVDLKWQRQDQRHVYECRLDLAGLGKLKQIQVRPGTTLGLDLAVCDMDADGSFSWMTWGKHVDKRSAVDRRGDVVLLQEGATTGVISGHIRQQGSSAGGSWCRQDGRRWHGSPPKCMA